MLTNEREQQVIALCQALIQHKSYSGHEDGVAGRMKRAFEEQGYHETTVDGYGNVWGRIRGRWPGKVLLLDGHIDTVPVPDESK
jgi:acetylornithine deacetylase/succinyl-diaminopimelate desuccinylase-like protein